MALYCFNDNVNLPPVAVPPETLNVYGWSLSDVQTHSRTYSKIQIMLSNLLGRVSTQIFSEQLLDKDEGKLPVVHET